MSVPQATARDARTPPFATSDALIVSRSWSSSSARRVGLALGRGVPQRLAARSRCFDGRGEARVDADQHAAVRLVVAALGAVGGRLGQVVELRSRRAPAARHRELGAERVDLLEVVLEDDARLLADRA